MVLTILLILLLVVLTIGTLIYCIYKTSKKNWAIFNTAQSYIEEKIVSIKTVEDCDNLLAYIKKYYDQMEIAEFKIKYYRYYHFVRGIKYIINKNNID